MRIGIIGAGQVGATLARKLSDARHSVLLANSRSPASIAEIAEEAGARAVTVDAAVRDTDVVIIAIPERSIPLLRKRLVDGIPDHLIVVDAGNYYPSAGEAPIAAIENGMPESQWVAQQLGKPVVKAFNTMLANSLGTKGKPAGEDGRIALPVSGDGPGDKKIVIDLIDAVGFDGIDAGSLAESWRQQPGNPACCSDLQADGLRLALSRADRTTAPHLRDLILQKIGQLRDVPTFEDLISINRAVHGL